MQIYSKHNQQHLQSNPAMANQCGCIANITNNICSQKRSGQTCGGFIAKQPTTSIVEIDEGEQIWIYSKRNQQHL